MTTGGRVKVLNHGLGEKEWSVREIRRYGATGSVVKQVIRGVLTERGEKGISQGQEKVYTGDKLEAIDLGKAPDDISGVCRKLGVSRTALLRRERISSLSKVWPSVFRSWFESFSFRDPFPIFSSRRRSAMW